MLFSSQRIWQWAILGALLGLGAPSGLWIALEALTPEPTEVANLAYWYSGIATIIVFTGFGAVAGYFMQRIEHLSFNDALTKLYNRRYFMQRLEEDFALSERYQTPLSVIMLDLDHFKKVNDNYGHLVGDQTLQTIGRVLKKECRKTDTPARYGGEEFIITCPNTNKDDSYHLAERIRQAVEQLGPEELGFEGPQTISLGAVCITPEENSLSLKEILTKADEALYQAKDSGRNRTVLVGDNNTTS